MKLAAVLGAGGLVGVAHHIGVLDAVESEAGLSEGAFDLMVGTSAGGAVAAYVRSGWSASSLRQRVADLSLAAPVLASSGLIDICRRGIGSAYTLARTTVRVPSMLSVTPAPLLRRCFPAGLFTIGEGAGILEVELPRRWPERPLWLSTYDLVHRRRLVLGLARDVYLPLPAAVRASCAIPGLYAPVQAAGRVLVDGGAWSLTNLDLLSESDCRAAICVAPLAFDPDRPPSPAHRLAREASTRFVLRTARRLRSRGVKVALLLPGPREVAAHGLNLMRSKGLVEVSEIAWEETTRAIRSGALGRELSSLGC